MIELKVVTLINSLAKLKYSSNIIGEARNQIISIIQIKVHTKSNIAFE